MRAVIALALLPALVLPACAPPETKPFVPMDLSADADADADAPATASPRRSATGEAPGPRTETVRVAPGTKVVVEWPAAPDANTKAMIEVFRDFYAGSFKAVVSGGGDTTYLSNLEMVVVNDVLSWRQRFLDEHRSVRGTARLYALNVSALVGRGAQLDVCVDQSGMQMIDTTTGTKARRQSKWTREPFLQSAGMRRGDDGVWRIAMFRHAVLPSERAKGCLR
ncbi:MULTISPECIES: hypothetical protein [unclassified Streptosporangium]|uniref:hypothetical protein n=1 Tax=unclassified Streptosporangium TaxID=2632669 RepID=UPI002E2B00EE|nr:MULTISPECIES: hypothetical protein [unclassified Streptosporangium]